ncbi:MAG: hypothetical protein DLM53_10300 [Candidatus Eremiobacter antarcticus]|nr:MAG: hypothetical protein DLM53_10300 [Candidatus Eremiobacter sp. RRmetagenome_bin22]
MKLYTVVGLAVFGCQKFKKANACERHYQRKPLLREPRGCLAKALDVGEKTAAARAGGIWYLRYHRTPAGVRQHQANISVALYIDGRQRHIGETKKRILYGRNASGIRQLGGSRDRCQRQNRGVLNDRVDRLRAGTARSLDRGAL